MQKKTCCFIGPGQLPSDQMEAILQRLNEEVDRLICLGVTDFFSGGARGFDQIAAALVIAKKEMGSNIRLIFALPCRKQDALWTRRERKLYRHLLAEADGIRYVSGRRSKGCMERRDRYMADRSGYCVCALTHSFSGAAATVGYAAKKGVRIISIAAEAYSCAYVK